MPSTDIVKIALLQGRTVLTEVESKEVIKDSGINVVDTELAFSRAEAVLLASKIGFPVVLKIVSPEILHKSDQGGVKIGLSTVDQVESAYDSIIASAKANVPEASIQGLSVQKMAEPGVEVIIGSTKDPQFGHVVMFGLGGVMVEILRDVSLRLVPLTAKDAYEMVREIKSLPILQGYRQYPASDMASIEGTILKLSGFLEKHPEIKELDLNPVICYPDGLIAVDARIILEDTMLS